MLYGSLRTCLRNCKEVFENWTKLNFCLRKKKLSKHVILFTNDGCPFPKAQDRVRVFSKIADMKSSKISFQLIPFGASFEYKFYKVTWAYFAF